MAFLGMRSNNDWATNQRPENWRETILFLFPNGDVPLTALLGKAKGEKVDDPTFHWWEKGLPAQRMTVTGCYTDSILSTAYTTGGVVGTVLYLKGAEATAAEFRVGHQVLLRVSTNDAYDTNAEVVARVLNGDSSYIACKLLQAEPVAACLASVDTLLVIGNINAEGAPMPDAIAYNPTEKYNYCQIFRTPLSITRTARKTRLRTGDQYKEAKRECLQMHSIEMEKAFLWGYPLVGTGDNGKPKRSTKGLITAIRESGSGAITSNFSTDSNYDGASWIDKGEEWLDAQLEQIFRYGSTERVCFCGSQVILELNKLIKMYSNYQLQPKVMGYGIKVMEWYTAFGTLYLQRHPLFSYESTNSRAMVIFDNDDLKYQYIDDTTFYDDPDKRNTGRSRIDGTDEEYLTEAGLEFHHLKKCGYLSGFGTDNP